MARQPAEEPKVRIPVPVGGPRPVLREDRCPFKGAFLNGDFVIHLKNALPSFMLEISTVSQEIR
jgi:hypothetical protein